MFGHIPHIILIRQLFKWLNNLRNILQTEISNCIPFLFVLIWPSNGLETQRGNQPLSGYSKIIFWIWRCDFYLVETTKIQRYDQGDVLLITIDLHMFPNIATTTIFHVHQCENLLPELLLSGANMINRVLCYNCYDIHVHNIYITKLWSLSS